MIRPRNRRLLVLRAIASHVERHGYAPSIREIGRGAGLASTSSVTHHLSRLARMGLIEYRPRCPRALRVVLTSGVATVPVVLTSGVATVPVVPCSECGQDMPEDHTRHLAGGTK
ncbi:hypothetical protein Sme01_04090 [Sphaerisporangium melleum]|uniref:LexA repressor DNA-binding domain-containing protein n=1 Tax=Sphaerisporangium melleum TaxID=321316 RepID=A0A917VCB2_9ACTN|nr:hypothetical protein [Sphaerisporangium melleum]GGK62132.1 hypothetical protein GCM10007964_01640 [Sphaerisporangium melleum]GII67933.1 hypothetical protein Sme01_04090 [Sphaerisporangium melleum]